MPLNVTSLLEKVLSLNASDLHLSVGVPPIVRIHTQLTNLADIKNLTIEDINYVLSQILSKQQLELLEINKELDFSVALGNTARFRVNAFFQMGYPAIAMRLIPVTVPTIEQLNLPPIVSSLCNLQQGLILVVGPTGSGKSTAIASMIENINATRAEHIVTIEDPIEYVFQDKKSLIEQREMYLDTHSWVIALKSVLRQDPNIVVIGEMRDFETISAALTIAETGHLVFGTLHTNSAAQTIDRIIDSFPEERQSQIKVQLSQILEAILSLRLLPSPTKGVVPAVEVLLANSAVRNIIREGKTYQIDNIISTSASLGMISMEKSFAELVVANVVSVEEAFKNVLDQEALRRYLRALKFKDSEFLVN